MAVRRSPKPLVGVRFPPSEPIWAGSDNGSTGALQAFSRSSILRRSTNYGLLVLAGKYAVGVILRRRWFDSNEVHQICRRVHLGVIPDCLSGRGGFDPRLRRQTVGVWCNGNTVDFDSTALGSIPGTPAIFKHISKSRNFLARVDTT